MSKRRSVSTKARVALFAREHGICHMCNGLVHTGEAWDLSHEIPLELGGADDEANWRVAHRKCHRDHTATVDVPNIAKAKRRHARNIGIRKPPSLKGGGFAKYDKPPRVGATRITRATLPPRAIFTNEG